MSVERNAPKSIPARRGLRPVQVEDPHLKIRLFGTLEKQHPIRPHALMRAADPPGKRNRVLHDPAAVVHHHKIIPRSNHFVKRNRVFHNPR